MSDYFLKQTTKISFLRLCLILLVILTNQAYGQEITAYLENEAVIISLGQSELYGSPVDSIYLYSYNRTEDKWQQIPSDKQEKRDAQYFDKTDFQVYDGVVNHNDELVFLFKDAGDWAPEEAWISDENSRNYNRVTIKVEDPIYHQVKYVYIFRSSTLTVDPDLPDYISYDHSQDKVASKFYEIGHSSKGFWDDLLITQVGGGSGEEILDRMKIRVGVNYKGMVSIVLNEEFLQKQGVQYIDGLVRTIRNLKAKIIVDLGFYKYESEFNMLTFFTPRAYNLGEAFKKSFDSNDITITLLRVSFDNNPNAQGMMVYNPQGNMDLIDQQGDVDFFRNLNSGLNSWMITGNQGSSVAVGYFPDLAGTEELYYYDKPSGTKDGTSDTNPTTGSWGDVGILYRGSVSGSIDQLFLEFHFLPANQSSETRSLYQDFVSNDWEIEIGSSIYVPVELASFQAQVSGNDVVLNWTTASESNNYGFEIQRKLNGEQNWLVAGFVNGAGTTTNQQDYSFTDKNLLAGEYVYRLKQIDTDGIFKYSQEITAIITASSAEQKNNLLQEFSLHQNYPNPFNSSTTIEYSLSENGWTTIKMFNVSGKEEMNLVDGFCEAGNYKINLNLNSLSAGVYFLRLHQAENIDIIKMVYTK